MTMSYEYDAGSTRLLVEQDKTMDGVTPLALVQAMDLGLGTVAVSVTPEAAPALALAILEATGVRSEGDTHNHSYASHVIEGAKALREAINIRAKLAEQEAEDANVRAWLQAVYPNTAAAHPDVELAEHMRQKYQQNRDYFLKIEAEIVPAEIAEPRVLQYGDTCQDLDAKWRTQQGYSVEYDPTYAQWEITAHVGPVIRAKTIDRFSAAYFPMTEVL